MLRDQRTKHPHSFFSSWSLEAHQAPNLTPLEVTWPDLVLPHATPARRNCVKSLAVTLRISFTGLGDFALHPFPVLSIGRRFVCG
jgi:hypothetical protein